MDKSENYHSILDCVEDLVFERCGIADNASRTVILEAMKVAVLKEICEEVKKVSERINNLEDTLHGELR